MELFMAVAKLPKYGFDESGDTVEVVERPRGGLTAIMADGQTHGRAAKRVSHLVVAKASQLVADGVRDGAVARGVHDYLFAIRDGKVTTELTIISADYRTRSLVVTRNSHVPVLLRHADGVEMLDQTVEPIGVHEVMKPLIREVPLEPGQVVLAFTDGVYSAGKRYGESLPLSQIEQLVESANPEGTKTLADSVLELALELDRRRPGDDMAVLAVGVGPRRGDPSIRRLSISMPL